MAENTKIEWADHTFNPWEGCQKVGPGCDHCYAETRNARFGGGQAVNWGPDAPRRRTSASNWAQPLKWNAEAERTGKRARVFCASLADVFDNAVPAQWRIDLVRLILNTPHLDWLLLTKRIGNAAVMLETAFRACHAGREGWADNVPPHVWIGATIANQAEADRDIPKLLAVPAAKRFLSMEPLLAPVDLRSIPYGEGEMDCLKPDTWEEVIEQWRDTSDDWVEDFEDWFGVSMSGLAGPTHPAIDWVIVGGESGPGARPMHPDWARSLRDQCVAAGVPFLFKQWGEFAPEGVGADAWHVYPDGVVARDPLPAGVGRHVPSRPKRMVSSRIGSRVVSAYQREPSGRKPGFFDWASHNSRSSSLVFWAWSSVKK